MRDKSYAVSHSKVFPAVHSVSLATKNLKTAKVEEKVTWAEFREKQRQNFFVQFSFRQLELFGDAGHQGAQQLQVLVLVEDAR